MLSNELSYSSKPLSFEFRISLFDCVSYLRYNDTWGDWHGGNGGRLVSFETVVIGSNGVKRNGCVNGIVFRGNNGTIHGPYGSTGGESWETDIPSGCSVSYISGRAGDLLDAISFHYNCSTVTTTTATV